MVVDVDTNPETAEFRGVVAMPSFEVYRDGSFVEAMRGAETERLEELLTRHVGHTKG